jgi:hypothetical protein
VASVHKVILAVLAQKKTVDTPFRTEGWVLATWSNVKIHQDAEIRMGGVLVFLKNTSNGFSVAGKWNAGPVVVSNSRDCSILPCRGKNALLIEEPSEL